MKRLEIKRISNSRECTMGVIVDVTTGLPIVLTLELPDIQNKKNISCIPKGIYMCKPYVSEKYKDSFIISDVPDRTSILIHSGNTVNDIKGCICPGTIFGTHKVGMHKGIPAVLDSRKALITLKNYVNNERFELVVS